MVEVALSSRNKQTWIWIDNPPMCKIGLSYLSALVCMIASKKDWNLRYLVKPWKSINHLPSAAPSVLEAFSKHFWGLFLLRGPVSQVLVVMPVSGLFLGFVLLVNNEPGMIWLWSWRKESGNERWPRGRWYRITRVNTLRVCFAGYINNEEKTNDHGMNHRFMAMVFFV